MRCDADDECKVPDRSLDIGPSHIYAGYGMFLRFHPECCSGEERCGEPCLGDHD